MAMCILNHSVGRWGEKNPMSSLARSELQVMVRRKPQRSPDLQIRAHDNTQKERTGKEKGRLGTEVERKKVKGWRDKKAGSWYHTPTRHPESPHAQWCSCCFLGALRLGLSLRWVRSQTLHWGVLLLTTLHLLNSGLNNTGNVGAPSLFLAL